MNDLKQSVAFCNADENSAQDFIWGTKAIGREINRTQRQTSHLLARGRIKSARKVGGTYVANRKALHKEFGAA
jgi:hypothetical protein